MAESGTGNTTVRVTAGIEPEDIMNIIEKVDYKISRKKFFPKKIQEEQLKKIRIIKNIPRIKKKI